MTIVWDIAPCVLLAVCRLSKALTEYIIRAMGAIIALMMEAVSALEMSVNFYEIT
jgi:hypothetical protein